MAELSFPEYSNIYPNLSATSMNAALLSNEQQFKQNQWNQRLFCCWDKKEEN